MVYCRFPRISYISKRSIAVFVDDLFSLYRETLNAYKNGIKMLIVSSNEMFKENLSISTELQDERVTNFQLRCLLARKKVIERIFELHQRYDVELHIHKLKP